MNLHNMLMVPENCVEVEVCSRIKPQVNSLFSITLSMSKDICLNRVRLPCPIPQKFKIKLVSNGIGVRIHLQKQKSNVIMKLQRLNEHASVVYEIMNSKHGLHT